MKSFHTTASIAFILFASQLLTFGSPQGYVIWWGSGISDQPSLSSTGVVAVAGQALTNVIAVAAGHFHALAIRSDGTVVGWGFNQSGQATGNASSDPEYASSTVRINGQELSNTIAVSAAWQHSLGLRSDGSVVAWGYGGRYHQTSVPAGLTGVIAIAAGMDRSLALRKDGSVAGWGSRKVPNWLSNIIAIAVADSDLGFDLALKSDGTVIQWGRNGIASSAPKNVTNITKIASGSSQCLALRRDGSVLEWSNATDNATLITGLSNVVSIASAQMHCLALKADGTIAAWGRMDRGRRPAVVPAGLSNVVAIAAGDNFCLAITTNAAIAERFHR